MCETMANVPVEENPSYVLTQDMIDAAMTEHFAFQDDIESDEAFSSPDESMEVDQDTQGSSLEDNTENSNSCTTIERRISTENINDVVNSETAFNSCSVLVIETGLNKSQSGSSNNKSDIVPTQPDINDSSKLGVDTSPSVNTSVLNSEVVDGNEQSHTDLISKNIQTPEECSVTESLPILKKILCEKPSENLGKSNIESIDLCDSDSDEFSEGELTEVETIDNELKSVMESNLMAEVGITVNKQKRCETSTSKTPEIITPRIAVKNVAQMSTAFNNIHKNDNIEKNMPSTSIGSANFSPINYNKTNNPNGSSNSSSSSVAAASSRENEQAQTPIQLNKIAVPHHTFVNSQGQKMKCVYFRNASTLPLVINSNQQSGSSKNVKYMLATQMKKGPVLSPIAALANMAKQSVGIQPVKAIQPKPAKVLATAPTLQKPSLLQNIPPVPHQFNQDSSLDSVIKSLLFHNYKKPYRSPDMTDSMPTYPCVDCSDRFLLQSSLSNHLNRYSIDIRYWCRICKVELQFFNRCVFLKHLRGHNYSMRLIDTTCISIFPVSKEMVDSGLVSLTFKESDSNISVPIEECILQNQKANDKKSQSKDSTSRSLNCTVTSKSQGTVVSTNPSSHKITTVIGQSKSVCFPSQTSVLLNSPKFSTTPSIVSKSLLPMLLAKTQKLSVVQSPHKQTNEQASLLKNKPAPKNVLLLCNNLPTTSGNVKQSTTNNSKSPNVAVESLSKQPKSNEIIIDDDTIEKTNNVEEEEVDVESDVLIVPSAGNEKKCLKKTKENRSKSASLKRYCSECGIGCLNISKHLNSHNRPTNPDLSCSICQLILPTKCSLKIHLRIHMRLAPYKCPDCGKDFYSWDELYAHLKFSCGHLAKCIRYMCLSCKSHFPTKSVLGHHIASKHSRDIFRCTSCPVAFFNKPNLLNHLLTSHPNDSVQGIDYKQCSLCPKKLLPSDKFLSHVQDHLNATNHSVSIYGYKCPMCSVVFANKMAFIIHQIKEKSEKEGKNGKKDKKNSATSTKTVAVQNFDQESQDNDGGELGNTGILPVYNTEFDEEPQIISRHPELPTEKDPLSLEGWEYAQDQRVKVKREELCIVCKKNVVTIVPGIDLNDQSLCCRQCVRPLDFDSTTNGRMKIDDKHKGFTVDMSDSFGNQSGMSTKRKRSTSKAIQRSSSCDEFRVNKKKRRTSDDVSQNNGYPETVNGRMDNSEMPCILFKGLSPAKKRSRKKQTKINSNNQTHIQGQVITSKSSDELVCSKCEFVADTREAFLEHITVHRSDPNSFQCLECGLCFVVLPSLELHLQMHHSIKDVSSYIEKNRSSLPQKVITVEEIDQCRVCYEMFDSNSSLEKHFRTHGMAFMNSLSKSP